MRMIINEVLNKLQALKAITINPVTGEGAPESIRKDITEPHPISRGLFAAGATLPTPSELGQVAAGLGKFFLAARLPQPRGSIARNK